MSATGTPARAQVHSDESAAATTSGDAKILLSDHNSLLAASMSFIISSVHDSRQLTSIVHQFAKRNTSYLH